MKKTKYSIRVNLERIADYLDIIRHDISSIEQDVHCNIWNEKEIKVRGISELCKNTYYGNLRLDEIKKDLKALFPSEETEILKR